MPIPVLPPELLDIVFENLQPIDSPNPRETGNWPTAQEVREPLSACTLVSRSWHPLAREHLFRHVVYSFQTPRDVDGWSKFALDTPQRWTVDIPFSAIYESREACERSLALKTLEMLFDFLQRSPAIRRSIRKLTLSSCITFGPTSLKGAWMWPIAPMSCSVDRNLFLSLISSLPHLESLRLHDIIVSEPRNTPRYLPRISVREVQLVSRYVEIPTHAICILATHLGDVGKFSLTSLSAPMKYSGDNDTLPADFPSSIALNTHSLTLSHVYDDAPLLMMSQILQRSSFLHNLRKLSITPASLAAIPGFDAVLRSCGSYLQHLKLVMNRGDEYEGFNGQTLNLSSLSSLQELTIGFGAAVERVGYSPYPGMSDFLRYFTTTVLSPSANPNLRKITFCLICEDRWIPPVDQERAHEHLWGDPTLQSNISEFETHFAKLIHMFGLKGMYAECNTIATEWLGIGSKVRLQHALPLIFPMLSREELLILDDDISAVV